MADRIKVHCPHDDCRQGYHITTKKLGSKVLCKSCQRQIELSIETRENAGDTHPQSSGNTITTELTEIGGFLIREQLGQGAFGVVHRGEDVRLERDLAIKLPHPAAIAKQDNAVRFLREAKAAAQLRHPNIVPVYAAGRENGQLYIVSAFIEGEPLDDVARGEPVAIDRAITIVMQLAGALVYAHRNGIVHRDVKPANVMLDTDDQPQLMDFGLARLEGSREKITQEGHIMGTPAYMSPEQALGENDNIGPASDQYSLGVLLYELLTGQLPFKGYVAVVLTHVIKHEPPAVESLRDDIPLDLAVICRKAMSKSITDRYEDCDALAADLQRFAAGDPIAARPLSRNRAAVALDETTSQRRIADRCDLSFDCARIDRSHLAEQHRTEQSFVCFVTETRSRHPDRNRTTEDTGSGRTDEHRQGESQRAGS